MQGTGGEIVMIVLLVAALVVLSRVKRTDSLQGTEKKTSVPGQMDEVILSPAAPAPAPSSTSDRQWITAARGRHNGH